MLDGLDMGGVDVFGDFVLVAVGGGDLVGWYGIDCG